MHMERIDLPTEAAAGPTKAPVRSVLLDALGLTPDDHFVEVGACTGAVTIEAARRAGRVTAFERSEQKARAARDNLRANGIPLGSRGLVELRVAEAPHGLPAGDVLFLGGSQHYEAILDRALELSIPRVGMAVSRLEVAGDAASVFRDRELLEDVLQVQVNTGYDLGGLTGFAADNPVYLLIGTHPSATASGTPGLIHPQSAAGQLNAATPPGDGQ